VSIREVFYKTTISEPIDLYAENQGSQDMENIFIGGWLQVYANSTDKPHVSYTPLFQQDAVSNAEESYRSGIKSLTMHTPQILTRNTE
jgi:hypothetical protein